MLPRWAPAPCTCAALPSRSVEKCLVKSLFFLPACLPALSILVFSFFSLPSTSKTYTMYCTHPPLHTHLPASHNRVPHHHDGHDPNNLPMSPHPTKCVRYPCPASNVTFTASFCPHPSHPSSPHRSTTHLHPRHPMQTPPQPVPPPATHLHATKRIHVNILIIIPAPRHNATKHTPHAQATYLSFRPCTPETTFRWPPHAAA